MLLMKKAFKILCIVITIFAFFLVIYKKIDTAPVKNRKTSPKPESGEKKVFKQSYITIHTVAR